MRSHKASSTILVLVLSNKEIFHVVIYNKAHLSGRKTIVIWGCLAYFSICKIGPLFAQFLNFIFICLLPLNVFPQLHNITLGAVYCSVI